MTLVQVTWCRGGGGVRKRLNGAGVCGWTGVATGTRIDWAQEGGYDYGSRD